MAFCVVSCVALSGCSSNPSFSGDYADGEQPSSTYSIAALKNMHIDDSHSINSVVIISGTITANDILGEFPNTLIVEDDSGAVELSVDVGDSKYVYKVGSTLTLSCSGLWIGSRGGTITLGLEPTSDYVVDDMDESDLLSRSTVSDDGVLLTPRVVTIAELDTSLVSCYLQLDGVQFDGDPTSYCERDADTGRTVSTKHTLVDGVGDSITLYVPSTVEYADDLTPEGELSMCVILEVYGGVYSVRLFAKQVNPL